MLIDSVLLRIEDSELPRLEMPPPHPRPRRPSAPVPPHQDHPTPLLRLEIQDLSTAGAHSFLASIEAASVLEDAVHAVTDLLYPGQYHEARPGTRSVTLVLHSFGGVAYTHGKALDDDHKEIHLSTDYIDSIKPNRLKSEIKGVIVHEMVHCWQWNGCGKAPGGLIEGIADWVRLRADLSPPHWKRTIGDRWDAGYQSTAWFLDWLEDKYGPGTVPRLNRMLKDIEYDEKKYWRDRCGLHKNVQELWKEYERWLEGEGKVEKDGSENQEDGGTTEGASGATENDIAATSEKVGSEKGEKGNGEGAEYGKYHNEPQKAESELDNGWTELSSGEDDLQRRDSEIA